MLLETKIIILAALIALSAFFSGIETAFFSLSSLKVKHLVRKKVKGAKTVERLKENPQRLLTTILIGNNVVNIGASALATSIAFDISLSHAVSITTGVMTLIILIFGEITPKSIAAKHNQGIAIIVAKPILALEYALFPVSILFEALARALTGSSSKKPVVTEEELKTFVSLGTEAGEIKESEKEMINRIFIFTDLEAKDVMSPRNRIVAVADGSRADDAARLLEKSGHSRLLVYRENLDSIVGFVHLIDVQKAARRKGARVKPLIRDILFVPSSTKLDTLLRFFQRKKQQIAAVVNEFGTNIGIVTIEDVLEEIVGEIIDEKEKVEPMIKRVSKKTCLVQGRADIDEINERCGLKLPSEEPYTISSYILRHLGRIPKEGEALGFPGCEIRIREMQKNTINLVSLTKKGKYFKK